MTIQRQILAIGGGGFSKYGVFTPDNKPIEEYFLKLTDKKNPNVCFIPTATGDSPKYIVDFYREFRTLPCKPSHLSLFDPHTTDIEGFLLGQDAIYVGGGNTKCMLALWREWTLDQVLRKAWENGVVLGGISAGSICWFEEGVTDSIPGDYRAIKALGFLKGSCCPHYDGDEKRKPAFHRLLKEGAIKGGIAIDDHAAVHYVGDQIQAVIRSNESSNAYSLSLKDGQVLEKKI